MTTSKEAFLNIQSDEKWVLYVQDKIRQNDIKNLNLSCKKIHTNLQDFTPRKESSKYFCMLTRIEEIETMNLGKFVDYTNNSFYFENLKMLNLSGKQNSYLRYCQGSGIETCLNFIGDFSKLKELDLSCLNYFFQ
jgi:hypothetical protein